MALVSSQFTIIDHQESKSFTTVITSNNPAAQQYNPDTKLYDPDWTKKIMVLTPSLYEAGSATDSITSSQVTNVRWFEADKPTTPIVNNTNYTVNTTGARGLQIKTNILSAATPSKDFICEITYTHPVTGLVSILKEIYSVTCIINGKSTINAISWTPQGNIFKDDIASLVAECNLYRGAKTETANVSYQWYKEDKTVVTDEGGGVGWKKLDATTNYGITGYTTFQITIPSNSVIKTASFKCMIKDTDSTSIGYNKFFFDIVSFTSQVSNMNCTVFSTGGEIMKNGGANGTGVSDLTARVFRADKELDVDGTLFAYRWYCLDANGAIVPKWGGLVDYKTTKTIRVESGKDLGRKTTFTVDVFDKNDPDLPK